MLLTGTSAEALAEYLGEGLFLTRAGLRQFWRKPRLSLKQIWQNRLNVNWIHHVQVR